MKKAVALGVFLSFLVIASTALAQSYVPLAPLPIGEGGSTPSTWTLTTYLTGMIRLLVALGGALAVVMLIIGGTQYVAAGINPSAKSDAKERIWNALIGLTLVLTSYLILNSIDPRLVQFNLSLSGAATGGASVQSSNTSTPIPSPYSSNNSTLFYTTRPPAAASVPAPVIPPEPPLASAPSTPITAASLISPEVAAALAQQSASGIYNAQLDPTNDLSIMVNCSVDPTCAWHSVTDLNHDGKTDMADMTLFGKMAGSFDVNQNGKIELGDKPAATSCFFKTPTANIQAMLPSEFPSDGGLGYSCRGADGTPAPPSVACNGATWIKVSALGDQCAMDHGFIDMPLGFVYGNGAQFGKFQGWVNGASSGSAVNLTTLFNTIFFTSSFGGFGWQTDQYNETDLGKLVYATVAQYDLNNDGLADFSEGGADMGAFKACKGAPASGACLFADFNGDKVIDDRDLGFVKLMRDNVFNGADSLQFIKWKLNWFESKMFDPTGYEDKQIIKYCIGHDVTQNCAVADVNGTRAQVFASCSNGDVFSNCGINDIKVDNADLSDFNTGTPPLDFNGDGKIDLK